MDLTKLSDADLAALQAGDLSKVSDEGLALMQQWQKAAQRDVDQHNIRAEGRQQLADSLGFGQKALAGYGQGVASMGRGVGNLFGLVSDDEIKEAAELDKPLLSTKTGSLFSTIGQAATLAPAAAESIPAAIALGAGVGALTTPGGVKERGEAALYGGAGGGAGAAVARWMGKGYEAAKRRLFANEAAEAPRNAMVRRAQELGYTIPPNEVRQDMLNSVLNAWSGPAKTRELASFRNQRVTDQLIAKELGIPTTQPITRKALDAYDMQQWKAYEAVRSLGKIKPDDEFRSTLHGLKAHYDRAAIEFPNYPGLKDISGRLDALNQKQFTASSAVDMMKILRMEADKAYANRDTALGKALRGASKAFEDQIDRTLQRRHAALYEPVEAAVPPTQVGLPPGVRPQIEGPKGRVAVRDNSTPPTSAAQRIDGRAPVDQGPPLLRKVREEQENTLLEEFRQARKRLAQSWQVRQALEGDHVNAAHFAKLLRKEKPLSGGLKDVAEVADYFPTATALTHKAPDPYSALDAYGGGFAGTFGTGTGMLLGGGPGAGLGLATMAALIGARPVVRSALLSKPGQAAARADIAPSPLELAAKATSPVVRRPLPVLGTLGGLGQLEEE